MDKLTRAFVGSNVVAIIGAFSILSIEFLNNFEKDNRVIDIIIASLFWGSILVQIILILRANLIRKNFEKSLKIKKSKDKISLISFFETPIGKISDIIFVISALMLLMLLFLNVSNSKFIILTLSILYLSFNCHLLYNSKNYKYIKKYYNRKKENIKK